MNAFILAVFLVALVPFRAAAGEIFGTISEGGKAVGDSVKVEVTSATKATYSTVTDKFGAYRLFVKEKGKCTITVSYKGQEPSGVVFSYDRSTRYDWVLELEDGKYSLRRK